MKQRKGFGIVIVAMVISMMALIFSSCAEDSIYETKKTSAIVEQEKTEANQADLNSLQPAPKISWSMERQNLIDRFKLMNDRSVYFYMYVFIEGIADPIGYYQVNKVSSVNSQLTNTEQIIECKSRYTTNSWTTLPSPAEDGSYGTNGDAVFGFTPEQIYIEHNMKYIVSTVPLQFTKPVNRLTLINVKDVKSAKILLDKIK